MRSHRMSARQRRRLGTRQGDSLGHGTCRSSFLEPSCAVVLSRRATTNRKRPVEAAGAVDAKNAPTAPWKTGRPVYHSSHRLCLLSLVTRRVSPMFPVNFVTDVPGCTLRRSSTRTEPPREHRLPKLPEAARFSHHSHHTGVPMDELDRHEQSE